MTRFQHMHLLAVERALRVVEHANRAPDSGEPHTLLLDDLRELRARLVDELGAGTGCGVCGGYGCEHCRRVDPAEYRRRLAVRAV